ncbi:hypothetical protein [Saccharothrix algeriensis]|uniref:PHA accumulation regulator DNA-binding N-terminal domain-containing protein n=2 Tax=Saccharothrix algeriensis TaxID=173560 RepID=A0ABS2SEW5_9PSEU|nr:hypothetical protein [Saccharothrix algeriensis]MBM7814812.1 hypothetical protein [Saccharothrix algeriensis]
MTAGRPPSGDRARGRRVLLRERDGSLFDVDDQRVVDAGELLDDLRAGRRFRAHRRSTGADCTVEVLAEVLGPALSGPLTGHGGPVDPLSLLGLAPRPPADPGRRRG